MAQKVTEKKKLSLVMPSRKYRRKPDAKLVTPELPKQYRRKNPNKWCVDYLTKTDTYKFGMAQLVFHKRRNERSYWEFKLRSTGVDLTPFYDEINRELDHLCTLRFTEWELEGIRRVMPWLSDDFIEMLADFRLKREYIHVKKDPKYNGGLHIWAGTADGGCIPAIQATWFEIYVLKIVQNLYFDDLDIDWDASKTALREAVAKWNAALRSGVKFTISDFGVRRSIDDDWNEYMVKYMIDCCPAFVGTSNVYLAIKCGCKAIGTFAHELYALYQGIDSIPLHLSQAAVLNDWADEFRGNLGIALSDNFGFNAFLRDFDRYLAKLYDGCRHDSGDPFVWGHMLIDHYRKNNIPSNTKCGCWSDSLDVDHSIAIATEFHKDINVAFGIGGFLACKLVRFKGDKKRDALRMIMKLIMSNGKYAVKLSDSPGKVNCPDPKVIERAIEAFNYEPIPENKDALD